MIYALGENIVRSDSKEQMKSGRGRSSGGVHYVLGDPWSLYRPMSRKSSCRVQRGLDGDVAVKVYCREDS